MVEIYSILRISGISGITSLHTDDHIDTFCIWCIIILLMYAKCFVPARVKIT